jgi:ATP-binding cassette, subfamily B, bacterial
MKYKKIIKKYFNMYDLLRASSFLKPFIFKQWKAYLVLVFFMLVDIALTIFSAWFYGDIVNAAVNGNFERIRWLIPVGILLALLTMISGFIYKYFDAYTRNAIKRDVKEQLFQHILRLPAAKASNHHSGEYLSRFTTDIHSIDGMIGGNLINLIRLPIVFIAVLIYLMHINWTLSLISLSVGPIAAVSGVVFGLVLRKNSREIYNLIGKTNSFLSDAFQGLTVIRSFTLEKVTFGKFVGKNNNLFDLEMKNTRLSGWFGIGGQIIGWLTFLVSLCLGAIFILKGLITVGSLLTFINLVNHLVYPLTGLAGQWAGFQRSVTAVDRILEVLEIPVDSAELPSYQITDKNLAKSIEFRDVTFSYDEAKRVFENFNLNIRGGQVVALVGPSGAGKSTLFNLIQGFYQPQCGQILLDGIPSDELSLSELRSAISHVPQETFLFAGTIRENLLLARPNVTENEMIEAAKNANIHDYVMSLPLGYDTEIGERGIKLSGGQKQRIAITRAILKDAPILLLDEATSALDSETEYHVKKALDQLMKGRTTLVIAHRLSTVQNADVIIVMDEGKVVQVGKHRDLILQEGLYRKLHETAVIYEEKATLALISK